jgi:hypothetical protein
MGWLEDVGEFLGDLVGGCFETIIGWVVGIAVVIGICACCLWGISTVLSGR